MKSPFPARSPSVAALAVRQTVQRALAAAGLDITATPALDVTGTLRRALGGQRPAAGPADLGGDPGRMTVGSCSNASGTRSYKLHVPPGAAAGLRPLLVMLHGCTQSAEDFAAGTQMNRLADAHGFVVVYPEQSGLANPSKCWNWFEPDDQQRGRGEPSLIADIVREVVQAHAIDPRRIYVAGLSAGAAMAVVLGETYPEIFAGVGAHSGLAYASAHDIPSAMAAMKGGRRGLAGAVDPLTAGALQQQAAQAVPLIVFQGDRDHTVQASNATNLVAQAAAAYRAQRGEMLHVAEDTGVAPGGRRFIRNVHRVPDGPPLIEHWTLHGAGHAWSGGHPSGSHTDATGPDASAEMVRFFLALPGPRAAHR